MYMTDKYCTGRRYFVQVVLSFNYIFKDQTLKVFDTFDNVFVFNTQGAEKKLTVLSWD